MKTLRSISGLHGRLQEYEKGQFFISLHSSSSQEYNRPRTRSTVTIWHLPDSVIVILLKGIHIKDLLAFRSAHPYFRNIIDNNRSLWTFVSFADAWPSKTNACHFIRACNCGNIEASIKLAVSCLYREGLTKDDVYQVGQEAARYLCHAEALTPTTFPFFWIFIRPPWAPDGSCCKVQAFHCIKELVNKNRNKDLAFGVALTMKLQRLSVHGNDKEEEKKYFKMAIDQQSAPAVFFSLLDAIPDENNAAQELERVRLLRHLGVANILEAKLNLVKGYLQGQYGGISESMAKEYVQDFFTSSKPSKIHLIFSESHTSDISRYILVDWLVEVVGMKDFSAHTLYLAVSMFDRYLQMRNVQRSQVQLLGVAAMVVSSRFLGFDILTIREAAWLTDNSYSYHDVVKMMGELVAAVKGNIRVLTIQDYVKVLIAMAGESGYAAMLVEYIAMLCLLQSEMGQYSSAEIAASCLLLTRLLMNKENPWPEELQEWTGFSQEYLGLCTFHIHKKCLLEGAEVDYRDTKLQAVKMRYADLNRFSVSNIEIIGHRELCRRLGVTQLVNHGKNTKAIRFRNTDELILSPRRGRKSLHASFGEDIVDRNRTATPPISAARAIEESVSGYDGDLEEEDSDDTMSDKSDVLFELNDESFMTDAFDDSQEWDSEQSVMEEDSMIDAGDTDFDPTIASAPNTNGFLGFKEGNLACLSSLCHFGNNVNCHASGFSSSCCISNCSCQQTHLSIDLSLSSSSRICPGIDQTKTSASLASVPKVLSPLQFQSFGSCCPYGGNLRPLRTNDDSVVNSFSGKSGTANHSSDIPNHTTSSICDTQGSLYDEDCDFHPGKLSSRNHFFSHLSHQHIKDSCLKGICNKTSANLITSSPNFGGKSGILQHNTLIHLEPPLGEKCSPKEINPYGGVPKQKHSTAIPIICSSLTDVTLPSESRAVTITRQTSFARLAVDDRIHHKSTFLSSTPNSSFISKHSDQQSSQAQSEIDVPCTPETLSDKLLHNHFTRSNSAFTKASSTSTPSCLSEKVDSCKDTRFSKKCKLEPSSPSLKNFIVQDIVQKAKRSSSTSSKKSDSSDFHKSFESTLVTTRKRKH